MHIKAKPLRYEKDEFSGFMSKTTFDYHYDKHYIGYINKLNSIIDENDKFKNMDLRDIIKNSSGTTYNMAAQIFNHEFFFDSITPIPQDMPEKIKQILVASFSSIDKFYTSFINAAQVFGSGWVWLTYVKNKIEITSTTNADIPQNAPLLAVCDVWEHAYYIDYFNNRTTYASNFIKKYIDWKRVLQYFNECERHEKSESPKDRPS